MSRRKHLRSRARDALSVRNLLREFSGKVLSQIKPSDIEDYKSKRQADGATNASINRELACLKRMYNLAIKWGEAKKNPVMDVDFLKEPPGRTRYLTSEESARLLNCCAEHIRPVVFTALNTGMRLSEILNLKWNRVHIDHAIDPYAELKETKNNKARFVPLNDDMVALFGRLRQKQGAAEYVFLSTRSKPLRSVRKPFERAVKQAGILDFRFHDLLPIS